MPAFNFKVGDKVYFPSYDSNIHVLEFDTEGKLAIGYQGVNRKEYFTFKKDGRLSSIDNNTSIFPATKEKQEMLESLYEIKFEECK